METPIAEGLLKWATPTEAAYVAAVQEAGSLAAAARKTGVARQTIQEALRRLKVRAAGQGFAPEHDLKHPVPDPFVVRGASIYYDRDGKPTQTWVKSRLDNQAWADHVRAALEAMAADLPRVAPIPAPPLQPAELLNLYTFTDYHMGMLAWPEEGGADWDLDIAERVLMASFEHMVSNSPKAGTAVILLLGDFLHSDGFEALTPRNKHVLDVAARWPLIVRVTIRVIRRLIALALLSHDRVVLEVLEGNHDPDTTPVIREMFAAILESEPRVQVNRSPLPYHVYQHGRTMLAFHHGHIRKPDELPLRLAAQFAEVWGATTKRYAHTGHLHHVHEREHAGITMVQHPTLAAPDAHAARGLWISERAATSITYHTEFGQVARNTVKPEMLAANLEREQGEQVGRVREQSDLGGKSGKGPGNPRLKLW